MSETEFTDTVNEIVANTDEDELVELISDMVEIPSANQEKELAEFLVTWFDENGFDESYLQEWGPGRANAVGIIRGKGEGSGESITFNGHIDNGKGSHSQRGDDISEYLVYGERSKTPPWQTELTEVDGRLMGIGVNNDKGPLAAAMLTAKTIIDQDIELDGDLVIAGCGGECPMRSVDEFGGPEYSINGDGTRHLILSGKGETDYGVILETSQMGVKWGQPGILELKITIKGEQAYVPYVPKVGPENSALIRAQEVINFINKWAKKYQDENKYEYEAGIVQPNVVIGALRAGHPMDSMMQPGGAFLYVDIRVSPARTPRDVEKEFTEALNSNIDLDLEIENYYSQSGYAPDTEEQLSFANKVEEAHKKTFHSDPPDLPPAQHSRWHDTNIYHEMGIPTVAYAPGPGGQEEYTESFHRYSLSRDELAEGIKGYAGLMIEVCGDEL